MLGSRQYLIKHGNEIEIGDFGKVYPPEGGKSISKSVIHLFYGKLYEAG